MPIDSDSEIDTIDLNTETSTSEDTAADPGALSTEDPGLEAASTTPSPSTEDVKPADQITQAGKKPGAPVQGDALKSPQPKPNPTQPAPAEDFRKTLLDQKAQWGRERTQLQSQLDALQQQAQQWNAQRQRQEAEANRLKLKPWSPQHPEAPRTRERLANVKGYMAALEAATPEQQNDPAYRNGLARKMGVTADDAKLHDDWHQHREHTLADFSADPDGYVANVAKQIAAPLIQDALQQFQNHMQAVQEVQRDLGDMEAIKPYAPMIREALQNNVPYDYALKLAAQQRELDALKGTHSDATRSKAAADERVRLQKQGASITRDPRGAGLPDLYELAKKEADKDGVPTDSPRFMKILSRLEQSLRKS